MLISRLAGGLGNQLFQWAIAEASAARNDTEFSLDLSFYKTQSWRAFQLNEFKNIKFINPNEIDFKNKNVFFLPEDLSNEDIIPISYEKNEIVIIQGYWQSEKYFKDQELLIKEKLKIDESFKQDLLNKYPVLKEQTISIHIRRTDYIQLSHYHANQTLSYYDDALEILNKNNAKLVILSDDIQWCKENLKYKNTTFIENNTPFEDLYIMSLCKDNIIANSTFSWWAAWINENEYKKVIAPKNWFTNSNLNTKNLIPEQWIKI